MEEKLKERKKKVTPAIMHAHPFLAIENMPCSSTSRPYFPT
jgi:hypothetical protein